MGKETQSSKKTLPVTIILAGRPYLLKVNATDEVIIHQLANELNAKVAFFKNANPARDEQDCLALTLITTAVALQRTTGATAAPDAAPATAPGL